MITRMQLYLFLVPVCVLCCCGCTIFYTHVLIYGRACMCSSLDFEGVNFRERKAAAVKICAKVGCHKQNIQCRATPQHHACSFLHWREHHVFPCHPQLQKKLFASPYSFLLIFQVRTIIQTRTCGSCHCSLHCTHPNVSMCTTTICQHMWSQRACIHMLLVSSSISYTAHVPLLYVPHNRRWMQGVKIHAYEKYWQGLIPRDVWCMGLSSRRRKNWCTTGCIAHANCFPSAGALGLVSVCSDGACYIRVSVHMYSVPMFVCVFVCVCILMCVCVRAITLRCDTHCGIISWASLFLHV